MREKPKLQVTKDYDKFEMDPINRNFTPKPLLEASMKKHGFLPSGAIHCVRLPGGKLRVRRGHHRLHYAKRFGLAVWFIVDDCSADIYELEGDSSSRWGLRDFNDSRAKGGNRHCQIVQQFQKKHRLSTNVTASLLGGQSAGSGNLGGRIKDGTYRVADDTRLANAVVDITDACREAGISFATRSAFVSALSQVLQVPECDAELLKHKIVKLPALIQRRNNREGYLEELDALYNYGAKAKRFPLKFRAQELARERQATFGGKRAK